MTFLQKEQTCFFVLPLFERFFPRLALLLKDVNMQKFESYVGSLGTKLINSYVAIFTQTPFKKN